MYHECTGWPLSESVSNLCLCFRTRASTASQQVQSVSVRVSSDQVTEQSSRCKLSVGKKKREKLRVHVLNSHKIPALRHNRDFNIATAQRPREAMQVFIRINKICSRDTGLCSRRKSVGYRDGDYADPHTLEEWPRIMARRQRRRARRQPASQ